MLPRVLEPEVMDTADEAREYDAMDHAAVNRAFVADFLSAWAGDGVVLDVGTGTAQIPIEFCSQSPRGTVVAVDLSDEMLTLARRNATAAGVGGRVRVERANGRRLDYDDGSFAAVMSNSIVHHIPDPSTAFAEMVRVCAPGGRLFVRDLFRPPDAATLTRLVATHAAGATDRQRELFAASLHAALTVDEVREFVGRLGYPATTVRPTTDRHWTWSAVKPAGG